MASNHAQHASGQEPAGEEAQHSLNHSHSHSNNNNNNSIPQTASTAASMPVPVQNLSSGPTNLSGLVCNVHRTTGREPHSLVGATTTIVGDKLYVFGGRMLSRTRPELTSDLYELDLIRRHWTKLHTTGDIPPPRYFHSMCAVGDTKLVCYGGMSPRNNAGSAAAASAGAGETPAQDSQPEVVVMSDVHILDVPTRTWTRISTTNTPQGRYAHCATILPSSASFTSSSAPLSAIHNNPSSSNPHQGTLGVEIDGFGGAEMVVVGGQDSSNHYIEQISVFNLRSLKWTATTPLGRSCGAYRSVVAPLTGMHVSEIGAGHYEVDDPEEIEEQQRRLTMDGCPMLIYSNYNFLDVKLELQVRLPDGQLIEKMMEPQISPPGLRFPNGGIINGHFVVSGTYLTSSKQEYALWALDLKTLTWGRIDVGGSIFNHGSWNRGVLWNRRSTFVILGHRKRSLVEDYNHRRLNFAHICFVELEAFGLYDNPRKTTPTSNYMSVSAPAIPASLQPRIALQCVGGRPMSHSAEQLGLMALALPELSDMELLTLGGERIPVSSHILARRWGPYFIQLLRESTAVAGDQMSDVATLRASTTGSGNPPPSRASNITITPSASNTSQYSQGSTLVNNPGVMNSAASIASSSNSNNATKPLLPNLEVPSAHSLPPNSRPRTLYLPHTYLTIQLLVHYLYTSTLPPISSPLCTPQILCSLLQLARPYQVDGLLEATVERLHQVLDGRNAAAVFNAAAMAAGGGRGTGFFGGPGGTLEVLNGAASANTSFSEHDSEQHNYDPYAIPEMNELDGGINTSAGPGATATATTTTSGRPSSRRPSSANQRPSNLRINTNLPSTTPTGIPIRSRAESVDSASTATSASTNTSSSRRPSSSSREVSGGVAGGAGFATSAGGGGGIGVGGGMARGRSGRGEVWTGDISSVVGLQKRGLRGLMEGRRLRERGATNASADDPRTPGGGGAGVMISAGGAEGAGGGGVPTAVGA